MQEITVFQTNDGHTHKSEDAAKRHLAERFTSELFRIAHKCVGKKTNEIAEILARHIDTLSNAAEVCDEYREAGFGDILNS